MASRVPFTSHFPTSKRSACDRCRQQKLRCPPKEDDTHACARCVKAGLPCETGYTRPLGRSGQDDSNTLSPVGAAALATPRMVVAPTAQMGVEYTPPELSFSPSVTRGTRTISTISSGMAIDDASSWQSGELNGNQTLYKENGWESSTREGILNDWFDSAVNPSTLQENQPFPMNNFTNSMNQVDGGVGALFDESEMLHSGNDISETERPSGDPPARPSQETRTSTKRTNEDILCTVDCDLRLSQLNMELSRQLQHHIVAAQRRESPDVNLKTSGNPFQTTETNPNGKPRSNAFGDALCSTSEYLTILQSYGHARGVRSTVGPERHTPPLSIHPQPSLSFACILNLVSSYLRIIAIFDRLFQLLHDQFRNSDGSTLSAEYDMQTLPGLYLAGFPVQQSSLQIKILIQTIQHQFESMEKALGLPVEMRVSERKEAYPNGLLDGELARNLIQATFMKQIDQPLNGRRTPRPDANGAVPGSSASLKENMSRLKQLLEV